MSPAFLDETTAGETAPKGMRGAIVRVTAFVVRVGFLAKFNKARILMHVVRGENASGTEQRPEGPKLGQLMFIPMHTVVKKEVDRLGQQLTLANLEAVAGDAPTD